MRRINFRFAALLLAIGGVLAAVGYPLHAFQVTRNARMFLREAEHAQKESKDGEAVRYFLRYLELVPDDVDGLSKVGLLLAKMADSNPAAAESAYEFLEKALRLTPGQEDPKQLRRHLVSVAVKLGRYSDAEEHLVKHLLVSSPEDPELLLLSSQVQEGLGRYAQAAATLESVLRIAPSRLEVYARLAALLRRRLERPRDADAIIEKLLAENADACRAHVSAGEYFRETARGEERSRIQRAREQATIALRISPDDAAAIDLAVRCAVDVKDYSQARQLATRALKHNPRFGDMYILLANVEVEEQHRGAALTCLQQAVAANPHDLNVALALAAFLLDEKKADDAAKAVDQLKALHCPDRLVAFLRARILFARGQWLSASHAFEEARSELVDLPDWLKRVDFWQGQCYQQLGDADQQLTAYRRAITADPFWGPARAGAASALLSTGRIDEAIAEYQELVRLGDAPENSILDLVKLEILRNLRLERAGRNWTEAEQLLATAEKAFPENVQLPVLRAEMLLAQDHAEGAEQVIAQARNKTPKEKTFRLALATLASRQRKWDTAEKLLEETEKDLGDSVDLRLARAQYWLERYGKQAMDRLVTLLEREDRVLKADLPRLWRGLAGAFLQLDVYVRARRLCYRVSEAEPTDLPIRLVLFDLAWRADDPSGLDQAVKEIYNIEGSGPFWHYGSALKLVIGIKANKKQGASYLAEAQKHLIEARTLRPAWSRVPLLSAIASEAQDDADRAIEDYLKAIDLGDRSPWSVRRVVQLLSDQRRYIEADRVLRQLEDRQSPFSADLNRLAAEVSLQLDEFDRALEKARQAARNSDRYQDHMWLGLVLDILGQRARSGKRTVESDALWAEAEKELRQAVQEAKNAPDAWVALIQFFGRTNQKTKAEKTILEAESVIAAKLAPLAIGQCYEAINSPEQAEKKYLAALTAAPDDPAVVRCLAEFYVKQGKSQQAQAQLRRIAAGRLKTSEADLLWGRRALAVILGGQGTYDALQQGIDLIDQNLATSGAAVQDERVKAILLSGHPSRRQRQKSIEILESIVRDKRVFTAEDRFVLAKLYLAQGPNHWAQAAHHFRTLLSTDQNQPQYIANQPQYISAYVSALLDHKETAEAELWLQRLDQCAADHFATRVLRAQALCQRGQYDRALDLLMEFLDQAGSPTNGRQQRLGLLATALEQVGRQLPKSAPETVTEKFFAAAEKLYREIAAKDPDHQLVLAAYLARRKRVEEALPIAEKAWEGGTPSTIAGAMTALLSSASANPAQCTRCEKILLAAADKHGRPADLLFVLADYYSIENRAAEAEAAYREVLKKAPNLVVAMNNLACLLALRGKELDEAQRLIDKAISLSGPTAGLLDSRALVLLARGRPAAALQDIELVLDESPSPLAYFHEAQALQSLAKRPAALAALKAAQSRGLTANAVHPLERQAYETLCEVLR
jgi:tetratricopeptide (TPR) repeat protein